MQTVRLPFGSVFAAVFVLIILIDILFIFVS